MYSECVTCSKIGISCAGPKFVAMSAPELLAWCRARKSHLKLSNAQLAEKSGMPKGTIDRLFAGEHIDFRYETIRPLVKALVGGEWEGNPCPAPQDNGNSALLEQIEQLTAEKRQLRAHSEHLEQQHHEDMKFLREQLAYERENRMGLRNTLIVVSVLLAIAMLVIIAAWIT